MPRARLTDRKIKALTTSEPQTTWWDEVLTGFGIRVTEAGRKTFIVRYRSNGRRPRKTLGTYPAMTLKKAREEAKKTLSGVTVGEDPAQRMSFKELAELYLERHAKKQKKSWEEDKRQLEKDLIPAWGDRNAASIRRADVHAVLDGIVDRGSPVMANRTRALASKVFAFALGRGIVEYNPVQGVPRPGKEKTRQRVLTAAEIKTLWKALDGETDVMAAAFRLRLLTAQRGVEVHSMRWSDLDGSWWTIPASVAKNELAHRVPLSDQALAIIEALRETREGARKRRKSEWVLPSPRKGHIRSVGSAVRSIRKRTPFDWTPHDLRRTAATHMTRDLGVSRLVVSKILNHSDSSVTAIYDRASYDPEKREALDAWGVRVAEIVTESN